MKLLALVVFFGSLFLEDVNSQLSNDECVAATVIPSDEGITTKYTTIPIDATLATENSLDPVSECSFISTENSDGLTVWYSWQPSLSGEFSFSTAESTYTDDVFGEVNVETIIAIYKGNPTCESIVQLNCDQNLLSKVALTRGEQYYIKVGFLPSFGATGTTQIVLSVKPTPSIPLNTKCIDAEVVDLTSGKVVVTGDIERALADDASISCNVDSTDKGVWYKVQNPFEYPLAVTASSCNEQTEFDTIISVFVGDDCGSLSCVGTVDDLPNACDLLAVFDFAATAPFTYYILVQSFEEYAAGTFDLTITSTLDFFMLVDSQADIPTSPVGDVIIYQNVNSKLNIQAIFPDSTPIESVLVEFDNPARSYCEEFPPYSVFWDTEGNFFDATIPLGEHTVKATIYEQVGCTGVPGLSIEKEFEVFGCDVSFFAFDVVGGFNIYSIFDGNEFESFPCDVSIQAQLFCGFDIESVKFDLQQITATEISTYASQTETTAPYFLFANDGDFVNPGTIDPGSFTIAVTVNGIEHPPVSFTVLDVCVIS